MENFGEKIKELRLNKGLSQEDVASVVGCSVNTIYRWEHNKYVPSVPELMRLSKALGVKIVFENNRIEIVDN